MSATPEWLWLVIAAAIFGAAITVITLRQAGRKADDLARLPEPAPDEQEETL